MGIDWPKTRATLLGRLRDPNRSEEVCRVFFNIYWTPVFRLCLARGMSEADAEDLTQETIFVAMREITEGRFEYNPNKKYNSWLSRVVRNSCENLRKSFGYKIRGAGNDEVQRQLEDLTNELDDRAAELDEKLAQERAVEKVRREYSTVEWDVFVRFQQRELGAEDAAKLLGKKSAEAVWAFVYRVRRKIKENREELKLTDES